MGDPVPSAPRLSGFPGYSLGGGFSISIEADATATSYSLFVPSSNTTLTRDVNGGSPPTSLTFNELSSLSPFDTVELRAVNAAGSSDPLRITVLPAAQSGLSWQTSAAASVSGSEATLTGSGGAYDAIAYAALPSASGYWAHFDLTGIPGGYAFVGLTQSMTNTDPVSQVAPLIPYGFKANGGQILLQNNNGDAYISAEGVANASTVTIVYDGKSLLYYLDGVRNVAYAPNVDVDAHSAWKVAIAGYSQGTIKVASGTFSGELIAAAPTLTPTASPVYTGSNLAEVFVLTPGSAVDSYRVEALANTSVYANVTSWTSGGGNDVLPTVAIANAASYTVASVTSGAVSAKRIIPAIQDLTIVYDGVFSYDPILTQLDVQIANTNISADNFTLRYTYNDTEEVISTATKIDDQIPYVSIIRFSNVDVYGDVSMQMVAVKGSVESDAIQIAFSYTVPTPQYDPTLLDTGTGLPNACIYNPSTGTLVLRILSPPTLDKYTFSYGDMTIDSTSWNDDLTQGRFVTFEGLRFSGTIEGILTASFDSNTSSPTSVSVTVPAPVEIYPGLDNNVPYTYDPINNVLSLAVLPSPADKYILYKSNDPSSTWESTSWSDDPNTGQRTITFSNINIGGNIPMWLKRGFEAGGVTYTSEPLAFFFSYAILSSGTSTTISGVTLWDASAISTVKTAVLADIASASSSSRPQVVTSFIAQLLTTSASTEEKVSSLMAVALALPTGGSMSSLKQNFTDQLHSNLGVPYNTPYSISASLLGSPPAGATVTGYSYPATINLVIPDPGANNLTIDFDVPDQILMFTPGTQYLLHATSGGIGSATVYGVTYTRSSSRYLSLTDTTTGAQTTVNLGGTIDFPDIGKQFTIQFLGYPGGSGGAMSGGGGGGAPPCFLGDAPVLTPGGYVPISELQVGDKVLTPSGKAVAILSKSVTPNVKPCERHNPYVVPAGVFAATQDVYISPRHRIVLPGLGLVQARKLGLRQVAMEKPFTYYNLKVEDEEHMVVAGMAVESIPSMHRLVFGSRR